MLLGPLLSLFSVAFAQTPFSTTNWQGTLNGDSGVLQSLKPASDTSFDFSPADYFDLRNEIGNYHTGDLTLRYRKQGDTIWQEVDTAAQRNVTPKSSDDVPGDGILLHSTFDLAKELNITRKWMNKDDDLVLQASIANIDTSIIELGAFGFPIEFNNIFTNRTADNTTVKCVLLDPYIGLDAGYVQVTRLTGTGPNLVITPYGNHSRFEAWRFLNETGKQPTGYATQVFEGIYAWQTLSKAYAEQEWNATEPWNIPTTIMLKPGQEVSFALRFSVAPSVHKIEDVVAEKGVPLAIGFPGYVLPTDWKAKLFLLTKSAVKTIMTHPQGSLELTNYTARDPAWKAYHVEARKGSYGRAKIAIHYEDGKVQTVHYYITDTTTNTSAKLAKFLTTKQWFTNASDPFYRAPGVISYDYEKQQQVVQESRAWIAGMSDEGGAGSFEAAAMKVAVHPNSEEVAKLEAMVEGPVWGHLQNKEDGGTNDTSKYAVKRSLFYHDPEALPDFVYDPSFNFTTWSAWNKTEASQVWRAYDYVHVSALYWALYHAEIVSPGVLQLQNSTWYLLQAFETIIASQREFVDYGQVGLMGESIWLFILYALQTEGLTSEFGTLQAAMKSRQDIWANQTAPFGSEMAWDSTGQEGVYWWSKYFNDTATVEKTLSSIRGFMPTVAHWGWNGNARRYWDFLYAGKLKRIERMLHHYGSGLNSISLLDSYKSKKDPNDGAAFHDLRVGYGGNMGALTNIHEDGFGAMAFHSWPDTMKWDAYSGDYGPNYLGHIVGSSCYLVDHPIFGFVSFGGNVEEEGDLITVYPKDTVRRSLYVAPMGARLEMDAGVICAFVYDCSAKKLTLKLDKVEGENATSTVLMLIDTIGTGVKLTTDGLKQARGGFVVDLPSSIEFGL